MVELIAVCVTVVIVAAIVTAGFVVGSRPYGGGQSGLERWLAQREQQQQRAHELELERERTLRSQTTYPWPIDKPERNVE